MDVTDRVIKPETWELINALVNRGDIIPAATAAFRHAYPDAPEPMIDSAVFHVFRDGVGAALEWVAATERFLRNPNERIDYGATWHVIYHLYNWQQFEAVLPIGKEGVLERLKDMELLLNEGNSEAARAVLKQLEELFSGDVPHPKIG